MATERNIRTNFGFYPPENNGAAWGATLEGLERVLREAFPEPRLKYRKSGIHGMTVLDYEVQLSSDVWVYGTAAMPDPDYAYIALTDVTVDEAAAFAVWLRDSFVPAPHLVRFASSLAMENGEEAPRQLPASGGQAEIRDTMRSYLAPFDD
ncbi:hypothetical protein ACFVQ4_02580 [Streptomyces laurentii]|uniref:hypothetical protein n=1 Tax=Streptomyces laurentii TaxID=39478 RepID=UPI0036AF7832